MSEPIRIQRKRAKGWRMPENTVYVGRGSLWGNPFPDTGDPGARERCVEQYRRLFEAQPSYRRHAVLTIMRGNNERGEARIAEMSAALPSLSGKNLACWCGIISHGEYVPCHADVLLSIANNLPMEEVIRENTRRAKGEALR